MVLRRCASREQGADQRGEGGREREGGRDGQEAKVCNCACAGREGGEKGWEGGGGEGRERCTQLPAI